MQTEQRTTLEDADPRMIFGPEEDDLEEDDVARTDHPLPGGGLAKRGPDEDRPDEDDPARTDHPVPGEAS